MGNTVNRDDVMKTLQDSRLAALATASAQGKPHASIVFYVVDEDLNFYFVTREETHKAINITANPSVSLCVGVVPPLHVQVFGRAERIEEEDLRAEKLTALAKVGAGLEDIWPPILHISGNGYVLFKVVPERIRVLDLTDQSIAGENSPFSDLI